MKKELLDAGFYFDALEISSWTTNKNIVDRILDLKGKYKDNPEIQESLLKAQRYLTVERDRYEEEILPCLDYVRLLLTKRYGNEAEDAAIKCKLLSIEKIEQRIRSTSRSEISPDELPDELKKLLPEDLLNKLKGGLKPNLREVSEELFQKIVDWIEASEELKRLEPEINKFKRELLSFFSEGFFDPDASAKFKKLINETPFPIVANMSLPSLQKISEDVEQQIVPVFLRNKIKPKVKSLLATGKEINKKIETLNISIEALECMKLISGYLFSWADVPGKNNERLIGYLKEKFNIGWVKTAKIEKIDDGKTIRLYFEKDFLSLRLNDEKTKVKLEIDDGRTDEFIVKQENSKLNIYISGITITEHTEQKASIKYISLYDWEHKAEDYIKKIKSTVSVPLSETDYIVSVQVLISALEGLNKKLGKEAEQKKIQLSHHYKRITDGDVDLRAIRSRNKDIIKEIDRLIQEISQLKMDESKNESNFISIYLGTYNSEAAYLLPSGEVILLQAYHGPTSQGYTIPSFIKFFANGKFEKYGEPARQDLSVAPHLVVWGIKRLLGKSYQKAKDDGELDRFQYPIEKANDGSILLPIGNKKYTPIDICKIFLEKLKADCESDFNPIKGSITKAIVTHPAYFDSDTIAAVKAAASKAGFEQVELISEPEAAAIAYKDVIDFKSKPWVMVIDWGETLDIVIVIARFSLYGQGNPKIESIFPPCGNNHLGEIGINDALFEEAKHLYGLDDPNPREIKEIYSEIEKGKIDISTEKWVIRYLVYKGKPIQLKIAQNEKEIPSNEDKKGWIFIESALKRPWRRLPDGRWKYPNGILEGFKTCIRFALESNGLEFGAIDQLILVGGPMLMPCVRAAIEDVFQNNEKVISQLKKIEKDGFPVSPFEAVVRGAAYYGSQIFIKKTSPFGYGYLIEGVVGNILIPRGTACGIQIQEKTPLGWALGFDETIHVSLLRSIITPDREKYYKIGDYEFVPIVGQMGISFIPILEMDKDCIVSLTIKDLNSPNPPFRLELSRHQEIEVPKPITPEEWKKLFVGLNPCQIKKIIEQTDETLSLIYSKNADITKKIDGLLQEYSQFKEASFFSSLFEIFSGRKKKIFMLKDKSLDLVNEVFPEDFDALKTKCSNLSEKEVIFVIDEKLKAIRSGLESETKAINELRELKKKVSKIKEESLNLIKDFYPNDFQSLKTKCVNLSEKEVIPIIDEELKTIRNKLKTELDEIDKLEGLQAKEKNVVNLIVEGEKLKSESCLYKKLTSHEKDIIWITLNQRAKQKLISGGLDGEIFVWDISSTSIEPVLRLKGHEGTVTNLVTTLNQNLLISAGSDGQLILWNLKNGKIVKKIKASEKGTSSSSILLTADGKLISGGGDGTIKVWKLPELEVEATLEGHKDRITCLSLTNDGKMLSSETDYIYSSNNDSFAPISSIFIWDFKGRKIIKKIKRYGEVTCLSISPDSRVLALGEKVDPKSQLSRIVLWDLEKFRLMDVLEGHQGSVEALVFTKDGMLISRDGIGNREDSKFSDIFIWNVDKGKALAKIQGHKGSKKCAAIDIALDDDEKFLVGGGSNGILIWDFLRIRGELKATLK